jgi:hypothetical protein
MLLRRMQKNPMTNTALVLRAVDRDDKDAAQAAENAIRIFLNFI